MIPIMLFLMTFQVGIWIPGHLNDELILSDTTLYGDVFENDNMNKLKQLKYVQAMDLAENQSQGDIASAWEEMNLTDDSLWNIRNILSHRHRNGKIEVKCKFQDLNQSIAWIDMQALSIQDPIPILKYAQKKHLMTQRPFYALAKYCIGDAPSRLVRIFRVKTKPGHGRYKFGIEVPFGIRTALRLSLIHI